MAIPFLAQTIFKDNVKLVFGDSSDLQIYHDGSNSRIGDAGTGNLIISGTNLQLTDTATGENFFKGQSNGAVRLYYDGTEKFITTSTGIDVTGTVNLDNLTINGAQGSDGQVLTSTGSGIAWEDASGGASLSGGAANKLAIWSGTDALTNDTNLHWDTTNDRLGIGTATPGSMLHLKSTGDVKLILEADSDNSGENDNPLIELKQDNSGIIGRLGMVGDAGQLFTNSRTNSTGLGTVYQQDLILFTENSARVYIKGENGSQGRVGIGAATPSQTLDVNGNVTANRYYGNGSTAFYVDPNDGTTGAILAGGLEIGHGSNGEYRIEVGEGRTGNGYAYIDFTGDTTYSDYGLRLIRNNTGANTSSQLLHRGTGTLNFKNQEAAHMTFDTSNTERMRIESGGDVGIGTTNPSAKLHVSGGHFLVSGTNYTEMAVDQTDSGKVKIGISSGTAQGFFMVRNDEAGHVASDPEFKILLNDSEKLRLDATGLGIGTASPGFKLDVSGTARATSDFRAPRFYDTNDSAYYLDPSSTSLLRHVDFKNGAVTKWYRSGANALQRADARVENSTTARLHWYGSNDSGGNTAFQHAWYDGSNYINVTASNPGVITFAGSAASMYIGSDRVFDDGYHPNADQWTTGRTLTIGSTGKTVTGGANVSWTLAEIGAAAAGDENIIDGATSIWNADGDGDVFTYNDANPVHNGYTVGAVVNIKGDGGELGSLVRAGIYSGDHVSVSRGYYVGTALNTTGATTQKVIDSVGNLIVGPDTVDIRSGTISVGGDANTYYPVVWYYNTQSQAFLNKIQIYRNYNETAPSTWNTSTHKGGLLLDLQANWGGWGGVNYDIKVNEFSETYSNMVGKISHFANSRGFAIWLRGGTATYHFYTEGPTTNPTVQLSAYDPGNNSTGVSSITSLDTSNINNRLYFRSGTLYSQNSQVLTVANEGSGNGIDADTVDGIQGGSFLRSDTADTATGIITINNDLYLGTYSGTTQARLFLNGTTANKQAKLQCTNGNLHIDSEDGHSLYLNYYEGTTDNVIIGNGNGGSSNTILKSTGRINAGEHVIANNNVYSGAGYFVFGTSTSEGEYIQRNGDNIEFVAGGAIKFDVHSTNGVHVRNGSTYYAQISNTGIGRFGNDVVAYYNFSDKRLKTNIKPTANNLDKVLKLNPVEYNWKEGYRKDKKEIGLIAQEVEKIIPEVVRENQRLNDDTLYKQIDYEHLVSTLIGAVQEQQKQIDELKSIINGGS